MDHSLNVKLLFHSIHVFPFTSSLLAFMKWYCLCTCIHSIILHGYLCWRIITIRLSFIQIIADLLVFTPFHRIICQLLTVVHWTLPYLRSSAESQLFRTSTYHHQFLSHSRQHHHQLICLLTELFSNTRSTMPPKKKKTHASSPSTPSIEASRSLRDKKKALASLPTATEGELPPPKEKGKKKKIASFYNAGEGATGLV